MKKMVVAICMCMFALSVFVVSVDAASVQASDSYSLKSIDGHVSSDLDCGSCEAKKECPEGEKKEGCTKDKQSCCKEGEGCCKEKKGCTKKEA